MNDEKLMVGRRPTFPLNFLSPQDADEWRDAGYGSQHQVVRDGCVQNKLAHNAASHQND